MLEVANVNEIVQILESIFPVKPRHLRLRLCRTPRPVWLRQHDRKRQQLASVPFETEGKAVDLHTLWVVGMFDNLRLFATDSDDIRSDGKISDIERELLRLAAPRDAEFRFRLVHVVVETANDLDAIGLFLHGRRTLDAPPRLRHVMREGKLRPALDVAEVEVADLYWIDARTLPVFRVVAAEVHKPRVLQVGRGKIIRRNRHEVVYSARNGFRFEFPFSVPVNAFAPKVGLLSIRPGQKVKPLLGLCRRKEQFNRVAPIEPQHIALFSRSFCQKRIRRQVRRRFPFAPHADVEVRLVTGELETCLELCRAGARMELAAHGGVVAPRV